MIKIPLLSAVFVMLTSISNAQKLPNVQSVSMRAPSAVKIDGNVLDWQNKFLANNGATGMAYTMANDDENLYLIGQITDPDILNFKVFQMGIMLIISKEDKEQISINYPVKDAKAYLGFRMKYKGKLPDREDQLDSIKTARNALIGQRAKWIVIKGIKGSDTISVYNDEGVKAAGLFDRQKAYNFEIAIPLKRLGLSVGKAEKFKYQVILQGNQQNGIVTISAPPNSTPEQIAMAQKMNESAQTLMASVNAPTDVKGEYTLMKAQ